MDSHQTNHLKLGVCALVMLGLSACSSSVATSTKKEGGAEKAVPVRLASVEGRDVRRTVEAVGTLYAFNESSISPEVDGRVDKLMVDVGDHVTKGQTLIEILPIEYKLAVDQQAALVEEAKAKLGLPDGEQDTTKAASVKKAAADLANAKQKFERTKQLEEQGLLPKQQYDADEADYQASQATYDVAVQDAKNLQAAIKEQSAERDLAEKKLRDTKVVAPFDGYVSARSVDIGQYLKASGATPIFTLVNVDPMRVRLKVPEKMAGWVPVGQPVTIAVEAYPDKTFSGKIWRINPSVDPQSRTFDAEALIENHERLLKPGFFVKATIDSTKVEHVLYIPQKALSYAYGIYKVYEVKNNKLKEKEVQLGDRTGTDVELIAGVPEGDRLAIAAEGQELAIKDGASVKVQGGKGEGGGKGDKAAKAAGDEKSDKAAEDAPDQGERPHKSKDSDSKG